MYAVLLQRLHKICRINYFCKQFGAINLYISTFKVLQGFRTLLLLHDNQLVFSIKDYQIILHICQVFRPTATPLHTYNNPLLILINLLKTHLNLSTLSIMIHLYKLQIKKFLKRTIIKAVI
jgi:hypothetical protein